LLFLARVFDFCPTAPKTVNPQADKRTGKVHSFIRFVTYSLPCFNPFYGLFYMNGKKVVPLNISELLKPLGLCYWICDDGTFHKKQGYTAISTHSFSLAEVNLLIKALNDKWDLKCTINRQGEAFFIRIPKKSVPILQSLLKDIMPPMMLYKIGL
jgi:hypothetical protein